MVEGGAETPKVTKPLTWRSLVPRALAASLDEPTEHGASAPHVEQRKGLAQKLDIIAKVAAERGIDFNEMAAPALQQIEKQEREGKITPGQAEFMRDESDALLCMINWAYDEGIIDQQMRSDLREAVN